MGWGSAIFLVAIIILVIIVVAVALIFYYKDKHKHHTKPCTIDSDCPSDQICFNNQCVDSTTKPVIISNPRHIAIPGQNLYLQGDSHRCPTADCCVDSSYG